MDPDMDMVMGIPGDDIGPPPPPDNPSSSKPPQQSIEEFWESTISKAPGKVSNIFPRSLYANILSPKKTSGDASIRNAAASYEAAAEACRTKVARIVRECHRTNQKYVDCDFDLEEDFFRSHKNCLEGLETRDEDDSDGQVVNTRELNNAISTLIDSRLLGGITSLPFELAPLKAVLDKDTRRNSGPACVHRIDWIFENPSFTEDGFSTSDVHQGANGDCWWIAAVATLCSMPGLLEKVCVARDENCGVYGFVFFRDGEWISVVVDDALYLNVPDYDADYDDYDPSGEKEQKYKKYHQTGSSALHFAKCHSQNETWLPILEKAYAKAHGDYEAIAGGNPGEAVEDMTGGVTTRLMTNKILNKQKLFVELMNKDKEFIFAVSSPWWGRDTEARQGLALGHAYSVLNAVEETGENGEKVQLVLIRNPWGKRSWNGKGEWSGAWSDGSKEWTPYWMKKLDHSFGDDGVFWMSFKDFCRKFDVVNRTRLFDEQWVIVQQWTSVHVPWIDGYLKTKFVVEIKKAGPVVVVLRQLDDRYFKGLEGQYWFDLQFRLQAKGAEVGEHIVHARSPVNYNDRSISAEVELEPGLYEVLPRMTANRTTARPHLEEVVKLNAEKNPEKLKQIGMNYDIAHAKGGFEQEELQKKEREKKKLEAEKKKEEEALAKAREEESKKEIVVILKDEVKDDAKQEEKTEDEKLSKKDSKEEIKAATKEESKDELKEEPKEEPKEEIKEEARDEAKAEVKIESKEPANEEKKEEGKAAPVSSSQKPQGSLPHSGSAQDAGDVEKEEKKDKIVVEFEVKEKLALDVEPAENPWNAVTVIGLLVYSKDPETKITLIKPELEEDMENGL